MKPGRALEGPLCREKPKGAVATEAQRAKLLWTRPFQDKTATYVVLFLATKDMELHLTFSGKNRKNRLRTDVLSLTG